MRVPLEITYRNVEKTDFIENIIREKAAKLDGYHDGIISCRVSVEQPQEFQKSGNPYRVRIGVRVPPGKELVVRRELGEGQMHESLRTVVTDAFKTLARQLKKQKGKQHGDVKVHTDMYEAALVVRMFPEDEYGFVKTLTGREVYFHRNSVLNDDFDRLEIGTGVRIFVTDGDKGPQASTVQLEDKPGVRAAKTDEDAVGMPADWERR